MNIRKEPIVETKRILMACLALFPWLPSCKPPDDPTAPTIPPWRSFRWDISKKDSLIEQEFVVTEYRSYSFDIEFHHNGLPESWIQFIGTGGDSFFTKDPNHPTHVGVDDAGGVDRLYELYRKGELILKHVDPGVVVPVHIRVEKIDPGTGNRTLMADETINTEALYKGGNGEVSRIITAVALRPGRYKVTAVTLRDVPLPPAPNAETYTALGIVYYAKVGTILE